MKKRIIYIAVLSVLLTACGGGGDNDNKSQPNSPNNSGVSHPDIVTSKITIDHTVSELTKNKINEIIAPFGTTPVSGTSIATIKQRSTIMALDTEGRIVMLGLSHGNTETVLNAESTALGLVQLNLLPFENITDTQLDEYIQQTSGFPVLVNSIKQSLNMGQLVSTDSNIIKQVGVVIQQLSERINALQVPVAQARLLPTNPSVDVPLPFNLVRDKVDKKSITIDASKRVVNNMPLAWEMTAKDYQGNLLPQGQIQISGAGLHHRLATKLSSLPYFGSMFDYFGANSVNVSDDDGRTFELTLSQTKASRIANLASILSESVGLAVDSETCNTAIVTAIVDAENLEEMASMNANDYIKNLFSIDRANLISKLRSSNHIASACSYDKSVLDRYLQYVVYKTSARLSLAYQIYEAVDTAYSYYSIAEQAALLKRYWNTKDEEGDEKYQYTVCIGRGGVISNCADELEIKIKKEVVSTAGAEFNVEDPEYFEVEARDWNDKKTLIPNKLEYQSSNPNVASIDNTGKIKTLKDGYTEISLMDQATGIKTKQPYKLTVYKPTFNKSEIKLAVGESVTLPLQNAKGQNITHNGLTQWGKSPSDIVYFSPELFTDRITGQTGIMIRGEKGGEADIVGNNLTDGSNVGVKVKIMGNYEIKFNRYTRSGATQDLICEKGYDSYGFSEYDRCTSPIDVNIYCEGVGCTNDRFFTSTTKAMMTWNFYRYEFSAGYTDNDCPLKHQQDLIPYYFIDEENYDTEKLQNFSPTSKYWRQGVYTGWHSVSSLSPLPNGNSIFKNFKLISPTSGTGGLVCVPYQASLDLTFRIYDSWENTYKNYDYNVLLE